MNKFKGRQPEEFGFERVSVAYFRCVRCPHTVVDVRGFEKKMSVHKGEHRFRDFAAKMR